MAFTLRFLSSITLVHEWYFVIAIGIQIGCENFGLISFLVC